MLWDGHNEFYARSELTALDPAVTELTWGRFFDPIEPVHCLLAIDEGRVVCLVLADESDNDTARALYDRLAEHTGSIVYIKEIEWAPALRLGR